MGTTTQKSTIDTHTKKKKQSIRFTKDRHQITEEENKRGRKKTFKNKSKTIKKMAIGTYISIMTLNVNGLNAPTKKDMDWLNGYKNKTCIYALYERPTSDLGTHTD